MALSHAILTSLLEENLTGYDLAKKFDTSLGFFWKASHQQIYQELKKMLEKGWLSSETIEQNGKPNKNVYALAPKGKSELDAWVSAETKPRVMKDDFFVKLYSVGHCNMEPIIDEIHKRKELHTKNLKLYNLIKQRNYASPENLPESRRGIYLALAAGILSEESQLKWCDEALGLLTEAG